MNFRKNKLILALSLSALSFFITKEFAVKDIFSVNGEKTEWLMSEKSTTPNDSDSEIGGESRRNFYPVSYN